MSPPHLLLLLFPLLLLPTTTAILSGRLGVNYGRLGSNLPPPSRSLPLILSLNAPHVKLYDADASVLSALAGSNLLLTPMLPNELLPNASSDPSFAARWLRPLASPALRLRYLLAGNEILSSPDPSLWPHLVPALSALRAALADLGLRRVKLGTTVAMDAFAISFPPSAAAFRADLRVLPSLLRFLRDSRSPFFLDAYPYFAWAQNPASIRLDYALLDPRAPSYTDPATGLVYRNLLEQQLDAVHFAMVRLGFHDIPIVLAETGWPNAGDYDQIGASVRNAAIYNRNLARWIAAGGGTPARPRMRVTGFVFALFNEDMKPGPGTERHWGLFHPNGTAVYAVDLSGRTPDAAYPPLPPAGGDTPYAGRIWCVARESAGKDAAALGAAVAYACSQANVTCRAIERGGECFSPDTAAAHASWAFNSYWQQYRRAGGTCFFNGLAEQTIVDPSHGSCRFPSLGR